MGDVQAFGGRDQAAAADDFKKGAGQLDIHGGCRSGKVAHSRGFAPNWGHDAVSVFKAGSYRAIGSNTIVDAPTAIYSEKICAIGA